MTYVKPILPALLLILLAIELFQRRGWRRRIGLACVLALFLASWRPSSYLCLLTVESWYPLNNVPQGEADAIVVLAAGINEIFPPTPRWTPGQDCYLRCRHAAWLYRNWKPLPVIVSGGVDHRGGPPVASVVREVIRSEGVPQDAIAVEGDSQSTFENAQFSARQLRERGVRRVALVTQATHMLRAERVFRKMGFEVIPAPCGFRTARFMGNVYELIPSMNAYRDTEDVLHEWVGLVWYRLRSRI